MENLPFIKRLYYSLSGYIFYWTYLTNVRKVMGMPWSRVVKWLPLLLLVVGWFGGWPSLWLWLFLSLAILLRLVYWLAYRVGYNIFVPNRKGGMMTVPDNAMETLAANQRVEIQATGTFSVKDREAFVLLRAAQYWQVPLGEHVVMVEQVRGRFLYQFFKGEMLQTVQKGWLIFGPTPREALAITFLTKWGPEFAENSTIYNIMNGADNLPPVQRQVLFSFYNEADQQLVWHNIVTDARRVRE